MQLVAMDRRNTRLKRKISDITPHKVYHEYFRGNMERYLSIHGGCLMVLKRILGGLSARRTGVTLFIGVHRTTVCRWEALFASALQAEASVWYREQQADMFTYLGKKTVVRLACHTVKGDATNAMVCRRRNYTRVRSSRCM